MSETFHSENDSRKELTMVLEDLSLPILDVFSGNDPKGANNCSPLPESLLNTRRPPWGTNVPDDLITSDGTLLYQYLKPTGRGRSIQVSASHDLAQPDLLP